MRAPKTFEEGMTRLEDILAKMQSEETTLAESVKLYAEAAGLVDYCHKMLDKVSLQIEEIDGRLRSEEHTSELQSRFDLVCRLLLEKKKTEHDTHLTTRQ